MKKTRMMCLIMALLMIFQAACIVQPVAAAEVGEPIAFTDIPDGYWAESEIDYMSSHGYLLGNKDGSFGPNDPIMRKTVAILLYRIDGQPEVAGNVSFPDVSQGIYYNAILWAAQTGIVTGYTDGTFRPNNTISRQHFAIMLYRYAKYKGYILEGDQEKSLTDFSDANSISDTSKPASLWACQNGFINGRKDGTFDPEGTTTRPQLAVIMARFLKKAESAELHTHEFTAGEVVEATCASTGYTVYACDCGYSYHGDITPEAHSWSPWIETVAATPDSLGVESRKCARCGTVEDRDLEYKEVEPIDVEAAIAYGNEYVTSTYGWTIDTRLNETNAGFNFGTTVFEFEGQEAILEAVKYQADLLYRESMEYYGRADSYDVCYYIYEFADGFWEVRLYRGFFIG